MLPLTSMPPCETATSSAVRRASRTRSGSATENWRTNYSLLSLEISTSEPWSEIKKPTTTMALGLRRTRVRFGRDLFQE